MVLEPKTNETQRKDRIGCCFCDLYYECVAYITTTTSYERNHNLLTKNIREIRNKMILKCVSNVLHLRHYNFENFSLFYKQNRNKSLLLSGISFLRGNLLIYNRCHNNFCRVSTSLTTSLREITFNYAAHFE